MIRKKLLLEDKIFKRSLYERVTSHNVDFTNEVPIVLPNI